GQRGLGGAARRRSRCGCRDQVHRIDEWRGLVGTARHENQPQQQQQVHCSAADQADTLGDTQRCSTHLSFSVSTTRPTLVTPAARTAAITLSTVPYCAASSPRM